MLSSKNVNVQPASNYGPSKYLGVGNHIVNVRGIELQEAKYDSGTNRPDVALVLHLEGPDQGPDFEGAPRDWDNPAKGTYKGQFAKVKIQPYNFTDNPTRSGNARNRDEDAVRAITILAENLGVRDQLDQIQANTLEEYVQMSNHVISSSDVTLSVVVGGKVYFREVDGEYRKRYDYYLPITSKGFRAYATEAMSDKVETFNADKHVYISEDNKRIEESLKSGNVTSEKQESADVNWEFDV